MRTFEKFLVCVVILLFALFPEQASSQVIAVRKQLVWFRPGKEVNTPRFSPDGKFIVFAARVHWPDGHEAEGLPESFFETLQQRKKREPRFADPVIELIDLKGNVTCETSYGTSPDVSTDNTLIIFAHQKNPITGLRSLADTLAGNNIQIFDCTSHKLRTVAEPEEGYLADPIFLAGQQSIAYTTDAAINGAWGGPVGMESADLGTNRKQVLLGENRSGSFPSLIEGSALVNGQMLTLQASPVGSSGFYMASKYNVELKSVFPEQKDLLSLGEFSSAGLRDISIQPRSENAVLLFLDYWRPFSIEERTWLPEFGIKNTNRTSFYSPNLKYYVAGEPDDYPDHFVLYQTATGRKLFSSPKCQAVYDIVWNRDSTGFAVVTVPLASRGTGYHEDLTVYRTQQ